MYLPACAFSIIGRRGCSPDSLDPDILKGYELPPIQSGRQKMTKWLLRAAIVLGLAALFLVFFEIRIEDGRLVVDQRSDQPETPTRATPPPAKVLPNADSAPPAEDIKRRDRKALENILEDEL